MAALLSTPPFHGHSVDEGEAGTTVSKLTSFATRLCDENDVLRAQVQRLQAQLQARDVEAEANCYAAMSRQAVTAAASAFGDGRSAQLLAVATRDLDIAQRTIAVLQAVWRSTWRATFSCGLSWLMGSSRHTRALS